MKIIHHLLVALLFAVFNGFSVTRACTRVVYKGPHNTILTGRTKDFLIKKLERLCFLPRENAKDFNP